MDRMYRLKNVTKVIKNQRVLEDINYEFENGKIYGLYGTNGSGKTMIIRVLSGLVVPTEGEVEIDGKVLHKDISFPPSVGIIIENMELLPKLTAKENLKALSEMPFKDVYDVIGKINFQTNEQMKNK